MSATQELIAAALAAADKLDEIAMSFCSCIHPYSGDLREACARAMVQPAAPDMAEVERLVHEFDRAAYRSGHAAASRAEPRGIDLQRTALLDYVRGVMAEHQEYDIERLCCAASFRAEELKAERDQFRDAAKLVPAASDPDPLHLSRILHELAGAASMCWTPRPSTAVFDSQQAIVFVEQAIAEIRSRMQAMNAAPHPVAAAEVLDPEYLISYLGEREDWRGRESLIERIRQAAPQSVCETCNGHGMIGGQSFYAPDEGDVPCPECSATQPVGEVPMPPKGHPLHKLGQRLAELLDEHQWAECERLLLEGWKHGRKTVVAAEVPMPDSVGLRFDGTSLHKEIDVRSYGDAREAAGYAAGLAAVRDYAVMRWKAEVALRPLENKHRRTLDDVWRQVIANTGGDPVALIGPCHDALVALRGEVK